MFYDSINVILWASWAADSLHQTACEHVAQSVQVVPKPILCSAYLMFSGLLVAVSRMHLVFRGVCMLLETAGTRWHWPSRSSMNLSSRMSVWRSLLCHSGMVSTLYREGTATVVFALLKRDFAAQALLSWHYSQEYLSASNVA